MVEQHIWLLLVYFPNSHLVKNHLAKFFPSAPLMLLCFLNNALGIHPCCVTSKSEVRYLANS